MKTPDANQFVRFLVEVPRYTSYPTAADFTAAVGPDGYAASLRAAAASPGAPVSLYVHLPFCRELCAFCGCHALAARTEARVDFRKSFARELSRLARLADDGLVTVEESRIRLTPLGRVFVRNVASVFDARLPQAAPGAGPRFSMSA
jgi:coproporphyrinogen III oxidase-like Fe-S oxidoreductase